jgi:glycosyltransferase involved in cell wall biosynthesis
MKVLFDHQAFDLQRWGGISRYHLELMRGLSREIAVELSLARSLNDHLPELNRLLGLGATDAGYLETFLGGARFPGRKQLRSVAKRLFPSMDAARVNRAASLDRLRAGAFDVFHPTYYYPYFLEALGGRPFVLTVHDLTHDVHPEHFSPHDALPAMRRELVARAARIIAVSEHTKRDLVEHLHVDPERVEVVHHGFAWSAPEEALPAAVPERYVLYTGTRASYKNWAFFVRAIAPLLLDDRDLHLVCTGHRLSAEEQELLVALRLSGKVVHVSTSEGGLRPLYARAAAFAFPSLYEGFGLPVLEAFAAGCPAALARKSSLPEIGGDAAVYFDPTDASSIREVLAATLADASLRALLVARGRARLGNFTWENTCAKTMAVYRRVLGERPDRSHHRIVLP